MCLAMPGKIVEINGAVSGYRTGRVNFGGVVRDICLQWVDAAVGDYVLAHAGLAISVLNPVEAEETLKAFDAMQTAVVTVPELPHEIR